VAHIRRSWRMWGRVRDQFWFHQSFATVVPISNSSNSELLALLSTAIVQRMPPGSRHSEIVSGRQIKFACEYNVHSASASYPVLHVLTCVA